MIHPIKSIIARNQMCISRHFDNTKYGKRIRSLKGISNSKICFIIGNGPSLEVADLERLHKLLIPTFAANRIYKIFDKTNWRPTYYSCEDPVIIRDIE